MFYVKSIRVFARCQQINYCYKRSYEMTDVMNLLRNMMIIKVSVLTLSHKKYEDVTCRIW